MDPLEYKSSVGCPISDRQREAASVLVRERGGIAWWKVGQGKTRIAILTFLCWPLQNETSQLLVYCRPEAFYDWQCEAAKMGLDPERLQVRSYARLSRQSAESECTDVIRNGRIGMVCFDELYLYKNPRSQRSESAHLISRSKPAIGLSGSIMTAKDITDIFGQCFAIGKHKRISRTLTDFRSQYMIGINEHGAVKHYPQRGAYANLMSACTEFSHVYMPKTSERTINEGYINVDVTSYQEELFEEMRETMTLQDYGLEINNAMAYIVKLQQIANGWVKDGEGNFNRIASHKPNACLAKVDEIVSEGGRVVVWCAFRHDVELLSSMESSRPHLTMMGGQAFDVAAWNTGKYPVVFATEASGSSVNHFKDVPNAIYYSMSPKWLDFQQSRGRTDRKDSTHDTCYYHYIHVKDTLDENILRRVRQAGSSESAMLKLAADMQAWLKKEMRDASEIETSHA